MCSKVEGSNGLHFFQRKNQIIFVAASFSPPAALAAQRLAPIFNQ